jgi:hypothetical protein
MALCLPSVENTGLDVLVFIRWNHECLCFTNAASTSKRYVGLRHFIVPRNGALFAGFKHCTVC